MGTYTTLCNVGDTFFGALVESKPWKVRRYEVVTILVCADEVYYNCDEYDEERSPKPSFLHIPESDFKNSLFATQEEAEQEVANIKKRYGDEQNHARFKFQKLQADMLLAWEMLEAHKIQEDELEEHFDFSSHTCDIVRELYHEGLKKDSEQQTEVQA